MQVYILQQRIYTNNEFIAVYDSLAKATATPTYQGVVAIEHGKDCLIIETKMGNTFVIHSTEVL